jgi:hypothetical protein
MRAPRLYFFQSCYMAKFKVGDKVEPIGPLVPEYMHHGIITAVIPNKYGVEWATEYEVRFSTILIANFYESQLRAVRTAGM